MDVCMRHRSRRPIISSRLLLVYTNIHLYMHYGYTLYARYIDLGRSARTAENNIQYFIIVAVVGARIYILLPRGAAGTQ